MKNLELALIAFDVKTVRDSQASLFGLWRDEPDCLPFKEFEELKRILRKMEDYFEKRWDELEDQ